MGPLFPIPDDPLDGVVRGYLEAQGHDAARVADRILSDLEPSCTPPGRPRRRLALLPLSAVAALLIALFAVSPRHAIQASPADVVRQAQKVHRDSVDHCYLVQTEASEGLRRHLPRLDLKREAHLWTRGDRFQVEPAFAGRGVWGRDEHGRVWVAPSNASALRFDADEVPEPLDLFCKVRAVHLPTLLGEVLRDCHLSFADKAPAGVRVIVATPRPNPRPGYGKARLEIDERTGIVRRLVLRPRLVGQEIATVTLHYLGSGVQPDNLYRAEGHLKPDAPVYDRSQSDQRGTLLVRALGGIR